LLHAWAVLTVAATVVLLALGSVVTTFRVGMADPVWPTYPWHLLLIDWNEPSAGFIIEHTHRLAGYVVGCLFIVLAVATCTVRTNRKLGWLGVAALGCVIVQGLLGGFRVKLNALVGTDLAIVHGVFAQVVFCLVVAIAVVTSPRWAPQDFGVPRSCARQGVRLSVLLTVFAFGQLVWGALLRQTMSPLAQRGHLLTAFAVVAMFAWLAKTVLGNSHLRRLLGRPILFLAGLLLLQLMLGVEAFLNRFTQATLPELVPTTPGLAVVRTLHVLVGSWILATAVSCAVLSYLAKWACAKEVVEKDEAYPPLRTPAAPETPMPMALARNGATHREGRA
jgi:heme A synthase